MQGGNYNGQTQGNYQNDGNQNFRGGNRGQGGRGRGGYFRGGRGGGNFQQRGNFQNRDGGNQGYNKYNNNGQ